MDNNDWAFLIELSKEADVKQGHALRVLFEMLQLMVGAAKESGEISDETKAPALEALVVLTAYHVGLLDDTELRRAFVLADVMNGERCDLRLRGLTTLINERLEERHGPWEVEREKRRAERAKEEPESDAVHRIALSMLEAEKSKTDGDDDQSSDDGIVGQSVAGATAAGSTKGH